MTATFDVAPGFAAGLASEGIASVADVLARSACVRDLPSRSNHLLRVAGLAIHVKRTKGARASAEATVIGRARAAGVPTARVAFVGADPEAGAIVGTIDLAPARPLDDLLREGAIARSLRAALSGRLARAVAALHGAGLFPRDVYLNHVYVDPAVGAASLALIDLERAIEPRWMPGRAARRDLAALLSSVPAGTVSRSELRRFLVRYFRARGLDPRTELAAGWVVAIERKARDIRGHVPGTPVGDAARPGFHLDD